MTKITKYDLKCDNCGKSFKAKLYDSINVTLDPSLIKLIANGKFNVVECPKCHINFYVAKEFLFHDMNKKIMMWVKPKEMNSFLGFLEKEGYLKQVIDTSTPIKISIHKLIWQSLKGWLKNKFGKQKEESKVKSTTVTKEEWEKILKEKQKKKQEKPKLEKVKTIKVDEGLVQKIIEKEILSEIKIKKEFKGCCEYCNQDIPYIFNKFYCGYCMKWHCERHRLPEEHSCSGNPKSPPGAFREIHTKRGIIVIGK